MGRHHDYTLIDSRTGYSDVVDICTIHLSDVLVDCFTLNNQSIECTRRRLTMHEVRRILTGAWPQLGDTDNPENWHAPPPAPRADRSRRNRAGRKR